MSGSAKEVFVHILDKVVKSNFHYEHMLTFASTQTFGLESRTVHLGTASSHLGTAGSIENRADPQSLAYMVVSAFLRKFYTEEESRYCTEIFFTTKHC